MTIVVGDLHGKYEVVDYVLDTFDEDIVFIGDYLDSFKRTKTDQLRVLDTVLLAVEAEPNRVTALKGNHELSYMAWDERCSGWNSGMQNEVYSRPMHLLKDYVWVLDTLISHAGVSNALLEQLNTNLTQYLEDGKLLGAGYARGGNAPVGGLYWCDWYKEFEPVIGVPQIVGHTGYRPQGSYNGIILDGNSFNIDCLDFVPQVIRVETKEIIDLPIKYLGDRGYVNG